MNGTIGEIRMFAGDFAPDGWAFCDHSIMGITLYQPLFSIIRNNFGGDGVTTFALPDFRGRNPIGVGQGPGLKSITLAEMGGSPEAKLAVENLPSHNHGLTGSVNLQVNNDTAGLSDDATNKRFAASGALFTAITTDLVDMAPAKSSLAVSNTGNGIPFTVEPPYIGINYIICIFGLYPPRPPVKS